MARKAWFRARSAGLFDRSAHGSGPEGWAAHLVFMDDRANRLGLEPLLGVAELAEYLGVPAQRIYDWRLTGVRPRGYRLGRELKFPVSEITRWLAERDERTGSADSTDGEAQR